MALLKELLITDTELAEAHLKESATSFDDDEMEKIRSAIIYTGIKDGTPEFGRMVRRIKGLKSLDPQAYHRIVDFE